MSDRKTTRSANIRSAEPLGSGIDLALRLFGPPRDVRPKTILCNQSDQIESLVLIESGAVKLTRENPCGRRMLVGIRSRGWLLGVAPAVAGGRWHVTAEVLLRARVRRLPLRAFQEAVDADARFRWAVFRMIGFDVVERTRRSALALEHVGDRLAAFLAELAQIGDRRADEILLPPLTQDEIAEGVPCVREAVTRELARFEARGLLRRAGRRIVVPLNGRFSIARGDENHDGR